MASSEEFERARHEAARSGIPDLPDSGMTELGSMVASTMEIYESHVQGGFSISQALYLTAVVITGNPGTPPSH